MATCYFLLNYARIYVYNSFGEAEPEKANLLFSFELCLINKYIIIISDLCINTCYFLLNYAQKVAWVRGWNPDLTTCYFLLNYAEVEDFVLNPLGWIRTCYFLLNYAPTILLQDPMYSPSNLVLLFSFELCLF